MRLIDEFQHVLSESFADTFSQERSRVRATELALGMLCSYGRRTISRSLCAVGRIHQDWSADYKLFSRSPWETEPLADPVIAEYTQRYPHGPIGVLMDDTKLGKRGRHIPTAFWQRDPLSPPFHLNLLFGLRFMQASLAFPHYREGDFSARGFPIRFVECPAVKKPGKRATPEQQKAYREAIKVQNLSYQGLGVMKELRERFDLLGYFGRRMLSVVDGSLCNRVIFRNLLDRVDIVARCRKDARLCFPAPEGSRRFYGEESFSPEAVRKDKTIPWKNARCYYGGAWHKVRYKEISDVLWQGGAGRRPVRLLVLAPLSYKTSAHSRIYYRQPAYLLTTDLESSARLLLQYYLDRWQIEVNHRDEKDILGVGQAQVWSRKSVPRQPAFVVACYSLLLLAALRCFGPGRTHDFVPLPRWRKKARRPSALDLITLLRKEINERPTNLTPNHNFTQNIALHAYT